MNREQRRSYIKKMRRIGLTKSEAIAMIEKENDFNIGDKVKIDYERVKRRAEHSSKEFMDFVNDHKNDVFTLDKDENHKNFYIFKENNDKDNELYMERPWLWSFMDLIKVEDVV